MKKAVSSQKQYLSRLLETQRLRGAEGGEALAQMLDKGGAEAMETEATEPARKKAAAPVRTLSTLESRTVELMGSNTDKFVQQVSCC